MICEWYPFLWLFPNMGAIMKMKFTWKHGHGTTIRTKTPLMLSNAICITLLHGYYNSIYMYKCVYMKLPIVLATNTVRNGFVSHLQQRKRYSLIYESLFCIHTQHHSLLCLNQSVLLTKCSSTTYLVAWRGIAPPISTATSSFIIYALASSVQSVCMKCLLVMLIAHLSTHLSSATTNQPPDHSAPAPPQILSPKMKSGNSLLPQINNLHTFSSFTWIWYFIIFVVVWLSEP